MTPRYNNFTPARVQIKAAQNCSMGGESLNTIHITKRKKTTAKKYGLPPKMEAGHIHNPATWSVTKLKLQLRQGRLQDKLQHRSHSQGIHPLQ